MCGRVHGIREVGKKLKFIDILQGESSVQVKMQNKPDVYEGDFKADSKFLRRGDVIGIEGVPVRTNAGELSVLASSITLLRHFFVNFFPALMLTLLGMHGKFKHCLSLRTFLQNAIQGFKN